MATPPQRPSQSPQDYATPRVFIDAVLGRLRIDRFAHDFAAAAHNRKAVTYFDLATDALRVPHWEAWVGEGEWGWLNPPFARIGPWAQRCAETAEAGGRIALLVPAAVGSNWYRDFVHRRARVLALNGRLAFMPDRPRWLYPKDCLLCLFAPDVTPDFSVWPWRQGGGPS